jgi:hypothetical protein
MQHLMHILPGAAAINVIIRGRIDQPYQYIVTSFG